MPDKAPRRPKRPELPFPPGTLLETDEDIRAAVLGEPPAPVAADNSVRRPYHPTLRPPIAILTMFDDGKPDGEVFRLRGDRFIIGRTEGDLLVPHDAHISARHVEVTRQHVNNVYRWVVTDLQSKHGLFVRTTRAVLADQSEVLVGRGYYRFELPGEDSAGTVDFEMMPPRPSTRNWSAEARTAHPSLLEMVGGKVRSRLVLSQPEYWIGTDPACSICREDDPFVEPRHARLYRDAKGRWQAEHNKTLNGLWLRMPQVTVEAMCQFQIGEQRFRLRGRG
jgi:pSer/pThr/pTyr-binding forkhead associated (FHA) protein